MKVAGTLLAVWTLLLAGQLVARADYPIQLALWPPDMQLVHEEESITGLRLEIYGRNRDMTGLDLGFVHETTGGFGGVALGLVSLVDGEMYGFQWVWIYGRAGGGAHGWTAAIVTRANGGLHGLQTGVVNLTEGDSAGVQLPGLYNGAKAHLSGVQVGLVNRAGDVEGVQLGLVNMAENMYGVQIGLWNQIDSKDNWNVIPIVNWKF